MFAYCNNNPVGRRDISGCFWGAVVGGAIAGALINTAAYLVSSGGDINSKDLMIAVGVGMVTGAFGGIAGICLDVKSQCCIVVGVISGCVTAVNTEGSLGTKLMAGAVAGCVAAAGTNLGTNSPVSTDCFFEEAVTTYAGSLAVGTQAEILNSTAQYAINQTDHPATVTTPPPVYYGSCVGGAPWNTYHAFM